VTEGVLGLGGVTVDQIGVVPHLPRSDEAMRLLEFRRQQGGMVATALVAAARLGCPAEFLGAVGDDPNGRYVLESFREEGIECSNVPEVPGGVTAFSWILVEQGSGKRAILHEPGVQRSDRLDSPLPELPEKGLLHLDGFWMHSALDLARRARERGLIVTLDVGHNQHDPRIEELLRLVDYAVPSLAFARRFTGVEEVPTMAERLLRLGPRAVILTLGELGSYTLTATGESYRLPAFQVEVADTTGAGDAFHGGLLFALRRGYPLRRAVQVASAVAALSCARLGGQSGLPRLEELKRFLSGNGHPLE
jgi:sulfofructose kinase